MTNNWKEAAGRYTDARTKLEANTKQQPPSTDTQHDNFSLQKQNQEILEASRELEAFMVSEGEMAKQLLEASGLHLIFGENNEGGGYGVVYFIDGKGIQQSIEAMGIWVAYSKEFNEPKKSPCTAIEVVNAAVLYGGKKPTEVMKWLRDELDKIASLAPIAD